MAPESAGALFDATEIDEILTLRVMTMTDEEKAEARATDPRAAAIIDRCDAMSPEELQQLHGVLRDPRGLDPAPDVIGGPFDPDPDRPWWDPATDASVDPETDTVVVDGVAVRKGSLVRVHPTRRADAQDLFFAEPGGAGDRGARTTSTAAPHVALVLGRRPGGRPARLVRPLLLLRPRRARAMDVDSTPIEPVDAARRRAGHENARQDHLGHRRGGCRRCSSSSGCGRYPTSSGT